MADPFISESESESDYRLNPFEVSPESGELQLQSWLVKYVAAAKANNNRARQEADDRLRELMVRPHTSYDLACTLNHQDSDIGLLAAVLLGQTITSHWMRLGGWMRLDIINRLVDRMSCLAFRHLAAQVLKILADYAVPIGGWPNLANCLTKYSTSLQESQNEVGLILISSFTSMIYFRPHFAELQALLLKYLKDDSSKRMRVAALRAVRPFLAFGHEDDVKDNIHSFVPGILNTGRHCIECGDEEDARIALIVFEMMIRSAAGPIREDSIKPIIKFSIEISANTSLDSITRYQAVQVLSWIAKQGNTSSYLQEQEIINPILEAMRNVVAKANEDDDDEENAEEDENEGNTENEGNAENDDVDIVQPTVELIDALERILKSR